MARVEIPVTILEFEENGNTIWVHSPMGTVLRIKTRSGIIAEKCDTSPVSHCDIYVEGFVRVCLSDAS